MRTISELIKNNISRNDMTREEELIFLDWCFDYYENKERFSKVFCSPYDLDNEKGSKRNGEKFTVLDRIKPCSVVGDIKNDEADIEILPLWKIQFEDGYTMAAYPEEIIVSEIKNNMRRESDKHYLSML